MRHKLLLADDSETIQRVIEMTFADEPVDVTTVSDGNAAIARLAVDPPDILLADIGMPGHDGYQVAMRVRQTPSLAHIPVVLLTGAFDPVDYGRAREAGCAGVLVKPFDPQMLIARVRQLLHTRTAAADEGASEAPAAGPPPAIADRDASAESPHAPAQAQAASADTPAPTPHPAANEVGGPAASVDAYFARLDRAFAQLEAGASVAPVADRQTLSPEPLDAANATPDPEEAVNVERLVSDEAAATGDVTRPEQDERRVPATNIDSSGPGRQATSPTLADAFLALLTREPGNVASAAATSGGSDVIEEIATRMSREIAERVVRELAPDIVSQIAERLVREEIARLCSALPQP